MLTHVLLPVRHAVTYPAMQERLNLLLTERARPGSDKAGIDRRIWDLYGETWAIMFTDLAGFSRHVAAFGVCHFLQVIAESFRVQIPIIERHDGVLLKVEGDSMMVLFRKPDSALACAIAMQNANHAYNADRPDEEKLIMSIGLGYGRVLRFGDQDVYGQEVNVACKLGEDLGKHWDIRMSADFHAAVAATPGLKCKPSDDVPAGTKMAWLVDYAQ